MKHFLHMHVSVIVAVVLPVVAAFQLNILLALPPEIIRC